MIESRDKAMLEVIIVCAIFGLVIYLLGRRFKQRISKADNSEQRVFIEHSYFNEKKGYENLFKDIFK